jgi:hypothetical protein
MSARLLGTLGQHARGRTLAAIVGAEAGPLPESGVAMAFAKEAQRSPEVLAEWVRWTHAPGCLFILVPPFLRGSCDFPKPWEATWVEALAGGETALGRALARERQHELRGELLPLERVGGQVITAGWRRHPAAGWVVITTLPLWSLIGLDHREEAVAWVQELLDQAGSPRTNTGAPESTTFLPESPDWTVLLHLCTSKFANEQLALDELQASRIFHIDQDEARMAMSRLVAAGWVGGGSLTPAGRNALVTGPYAHHARTLVRMSDV